MSSRLKGLLVPRVRLYCCMWEPFHSYHACETLSILHPKAQWLGTKHMRLCPLVMSQHVSRTNSVCVSPSQSAHFSSGNLVPTGPLLFVSFLLFGVRSQVPSQFLPKRSWGGGEREEVCGLHADTLLVLCKGLEHPQVLLPWDAGKDNCISVCVHLWGL